MSPSDASALQCPRCGNPWVPEKITSGESFPCQGCGAITIASLFPALTRPLRMGASGEEILTDSEASCFHHPDKRAATVCDECGRFLCTLCDIQFHDRHLCVSCIETGKRQDTMAIARKRTVLYDELALGLAVLPVLLVWPTIVTAPATLVIVLRHWRKPPGIMPRHRGKSVAAFIVALLEIAAWLALLFFVLKR